MKYPVASFFLLVLLAPVIAVAQTNSQGVKKRERASPRSATLKICQGVSIPDGYVVVGYVTSSVCPHGAYVLKKQESQVSDAMVSGRRQPEIQQTAVSRPRRVSMLRDTDVPSLPATPDARQPGLAGVTPTSIPLNASPASVPAPTMEEVAAGDVVRINTTLVTVPVSVLDRQGRFVPGLQREDFHVFENGVEQPIAYFEPTEKPFTVALLLDTSASTRFHLWEIKEAAISFAKQLRPQDRVLIVTFDDEVLLLTEATNDQDVITTVIQVNANTGSSTRLYDAVDLVINERLNKIQGRKAIVLFTDGVDTSSYLATYQSTLRETEELDALIYPIKYDTTDYLRSMSGGGSVTIVTNRSNWPFPGRNSSRVIYGTPSSGSPLPSSTKTDYERADQYLQGMADRTGGRLYKANDSTQLAQAFSSIAEELRRQYSLGYYPQSGAVQDEERRSISVRVRRLNVAVRSRNSYMRRPSVNATK
jgi:Ca-activated chloride channel family protein